MAGQERHISARPQPCASTVEQSATRIELFDSFSEHHQQQQRQKSQGQQQQVQKQEQQHEQKASDAAQIRASMAEQELKKVCIPLQLNATPCAFLPCNVRSIMACCGWCGCVTCAFDTL